MFSSRFKDLTGQTFGERIVTGFSHQCHRSGSYFWKVKCKCGNNKVVSGSRLKTTLSCTTCSGKINGRKGLDSQAKNKPSYFIRCGEFIKVGSSVNPEKRMRIMASSNPYDLELLLVDLNNNEKYWHERLKECHYKGEWYWYSKVCEIVDV